MTALERRGVSRSRRRLGSPRARRRRRATGSGWERRSGPPRSAPPRRAPEPIMRRPSSPKVAAGWASITSRAPVWPQVARSNRIRAQPSIRRLAKAAGNRSGATVSRRRSEMSAGQTCCGVLIGRGHVRRRQGVADAVEVEDASGQGRARAQNRIGDGAPGLAVQIDVARRSQGLDPRGPPRGVHVPTHHGPGAAARRRATADLEVGHADRARGAAAATVAAAIGAGAAQAPGDDIAQGAARAGDGEIAQKIVGGRRLQRLGGIADRGAAVSARRGLETPGGQVGLFRFCGVELGNDDRAGRIRRRIRRRPNVAGAALCVHREGQNDRWPFVGGAADGADGQDRRRTGVGSAGRRRRFRSWEPAAATTARSRKDARRGQATPAAAPAPAPEVAARAGDVVRVRVRPRPIRTARMGISGCISWVQRGRGLSSAIV